MPVPSQSLMRPALLGLLVAMAGLAGPASSQATSTEAQKLFASDGAGWDNFGRDIAVAGNVALIGANGANSHGAVYCYRKAGNAWTFSQKFTGSDTAKGDFFGWRVAMDGGYAIVSGQQHSVSAIGDGAAYVFQDSGSAWSEVQVLTAPDGAAYDHFGYSVALHGDLAVVGAPFKDDGGVDLGAVYVFRRSGPSWNFEQKLTASTADSFDNFGWQVDTDGITVIVSALGDEEPGKGETGAVFAFRKFGSTWQEPQRFVPGDAGPDDAFGWDLDLDGTALAVSSESHDHPFLNGGAIYVYRFDGSTWFEEDELAPSKLQAEHYLGFSVALQDDRLVAGAPSTGANYDGALYLFHNDGTRWVEVHQWLPGDAAVPGFPPGQLGMACAISGKVVFGGAPFHDGVTLKAGAIYRYDVTDLGLEIEPKAVLPNGLTVLTTNGGLALAPMGVVLQDISGAPFNLLLFLSNFDANGEHVLPLVVPPGASGLEATFLSLGYWQGNYKAISTPATLYFL